MNPRIAFLSTAHIHTKGFIERLLAHVGPGSLSLIWDDFAERGERYAAMAGCRFEPDLGKALADETTDGFVICAENTRHLPLLEKVITVGKPVFCEKPLVTSLEDLSALENLLARHPTPLCSGYFQPFSADIQSIQALIREGVFGTITRIRHRNAHHAAYGRWFDSVDLAWFTQPELSGGGGFMDMGTHSLHFVRTLFGPVDSVFAEIANHSGQYPTCDDFGIALLRFGNGILGTVEAGWTQTGGLSGLEIVGSEQSLWATPQGYVIGKPGQSAEPLPLTEPARLTRMERITALIRGEIFEADWKADLAASLDAVRIMSACQLSSAEGRWMQSGRGIPLSGMKR